MQLKNFIIFSFLIVAFLLFNCKKGYVPNLAERGFPTVVESVELGPGQADTLRIDPFMVAIPQGAFSDSVRFEILSGKPDNFKPKAPTGELPILAFAFRITDLKTGKYIMELAQPMPLTVTDGNITDQSKFYQISKQGDYSIISTAVEIIPGQLRYSVTSVEDGWVITVGPAAAD